MAELLYEEELQLQAEMQASQLNAEDRRSQLEKRAKALISTREQERDDFAREMLYKHWRENCDGVRSDDSKRITLHFASLRKDQMSEKQQTIASEKEEKRLFDEMYERERLKLENRYQQDVKRRKERDEEAVRVLNDQLADVMLRKKEAVVAQKKEVEELKNRWKAQDDAAEQVKQALYAKNKRFVQFYL